jgi:putative endonuclease
MYLMPLPFCVYILFSKKDFQLYTGFTSNLEARIKKHNSGGNKSTSYRRPLVLIFCEFYLFEDDARKREGYFKTTMGKKALKLMLRDSFEKMGYKNLTLKSLKILDDGEVELKKKELLNITI